MLHSHSLKKDLPIVDRYDFLIVGAGVIGSAVAWQLAERGASRILVIDPDLQGTFSSSELNAGGVRATFLVPINLEFSRLSIDFFSKHSLELGYQPCGYHWLIQHDKMADFQMRAQVFEKASWPIEMWDVPELSRRLPWIDKTQDLAGALVAPRDGLINPNRLKEFYREKARAKGVQFLDRAWLMKFNSKKATLRTQKGSVGAHMIKTALENKGEFQGSDLDIQVENVINCAGPWAVQVASTLGYQVPSQAVRRQVCIFSSRELSEPKFGMIVDPSGVYFHPEATTILAGFAHPEQLPGFNFDYEGESFFHDQIWAPLHERAHAFESLKHITGWAGLYEVSPDESAIMGKVKDGVYECHSFSGHGVMHSYAAALSLSELIVHGQYKAIDASVLHASRFQSGKFLRERAVI